MLYEIENDSIRLAVNSLGAELCSLFDKQDQTEHMWQAKPEVWGRHAPILFPIVGGLKNDHTMINTRSYTMKRHGFLREMEPSLPEHSKNQLLFEFTSNKHTLAQYPFEFAIRIGYSLEGRQLINSFEVINKGEQDMRFNLGGHPAFAIPFRKDETIEDYYLEFEREEQAERYLLDDKGLFNGSKELVMNNVNSIAITRNLFDQDAIVFKDLKSTSVSIRSGNHNKSLKVDFEGWPYLGIWAKPAAHYVCIEPWIGCADSAQSNGQFIEKEKLVKLKAEERFMSSFAISLNP